MRPKSIGEIFGNDSAKKIINSKTSETMPKAILLHGPPGTGKTTMARIIFGMLKADKGCIYEYNMATQGGIDTSRQIEEKVNWQPGMGEINGFLLDEAHKAQSNTLSGFLKPLEDSPDYNYFVFCTSDKPEFLKKFKPTERKAFLRRCTEIKLETISDDDGYNMLSICLEDMKIPSKQVPDDIIDQILSISNGVPAVMYKNLETIIDLESPEEMIQYLKSVDAETEDATPEMKKLFTNILNGNWNACAGEISELRKQKIDIESFRMPMLGYMLSVMLNAQANKVVADRAQYCIDNLKSPLHEGRIYQFAGIVRGACYLGKAG